VNRIVIALMLAGLAVGCTEEEGITGPAAPEELSSALLLPIDRETRIEALLLLSGESYDCNQLVEYEDEGDLSSAYDSWLTGRHSLSVLRREASLTWDGLYPGATSETLALDDMGMNRASTSAVFFDGEIILSEEGGYVLLEGYEDAGEADARIDLGVLGGPFVAEVCATIERPGT
jgi:hypothetical protein